MEATSTPGGGPAAPGGRQAGHQQLEACLPEAGWQVVLVMHGGKTPPPLQAEAKHSSSYQVVSSLLLCKPTPTPPPPMFLPTAQEELHPQEATGPGIVIRPSPAGALPPTAPQLLPQGSEPPQQPPFPPSTLAGDSSSSGRVTQSALLHTVVELQGERSFAFRRQPFPCTNTQVQGPRVPPTWPTA